MIGMVGDIQVYTCDRGLGVGEKKKGDAEEWKAAAQVRLQKVCVEGFDPSPAGWKSEGESCMIMCDYFVSHGAVASGSFGAARHSVAQHGSPAAPALGTAPQTRTTA